jgi:pilus assembly protein Flp/PilA
VLRGKGGCSRHVKGNSRLHLTGQSGQIQRGDSRINISGESAHQCSKGRRNTMTLIDKAIVAILSKAFAVKDEEGQGMAEYGLILALVAVVCAAAFTLLQGGINTTLNKVTNLL